MRKNIYFKITALLSFLLPLAVYALTTCPKSYTEDCGEFITAASTLGVLHPPGYPLYTMLGKLFTYIPISDIAWRVNFMSGFFGALAGLFLFLLIARLIKNIPIAFVSAMLFCFSPVFWSQCVAAEVYSLNAFFLAVCLYILQIWRETDKSKFLYLASFIYGLSLANHYFMLLAGPFFIVFAFWNKPELIKKPAVLLGCIGLFILGLAPYIYLPLASKANPALDWGNPENLRNFLNHVLRLQYKGGVPGNYGIETYLAFAAEFLRELAGQFGLPLIVIGLAGFCRLFDSDMKFLFLTAGVFVFNGFVLIFMQRCPFNQQMAEIMSVYYFPCYLVFACWIAFGLLLIFELLSKFFSKYPGTRALYYGTILALAVIQLTGNYHKNDLIKNYYCYDFMKSVFSLMDKNAVFFASSDFAVFNALYLQQVEKYRTDITMYEDAGIVPYGYLGDPVKFQGFSKEEIQELHRRVFSRIIEENYDKRPLYFIRRFDFAPDSAYELRQVGLIYRVVKKGDKYNPGFDPLKRVYLRNLSDDSVYKDYDIQKLVSIYWATLATYYISVNDLKNAAKCYEEVSKYNNEVNLNNASAFFIAAENLDMALKCLNKISSIDPDFHAHNFNMAVIYDKKGDKEPAIKNYEIFCENYRGIPGYEKYVKYAETRIEALKK